MFSPGTRPKTAASRARCSTRVDCAASRRSRCRRRPAASAGRRRRLRHRCCRRPIWSGRRRCEWYRRHCCRCASPSPNSETLVLPMKIAPAARIRSMASASRDAGGALNGGRKKPWVVVNPATFARSFTACGNPCIQPLPVAGGQFPVLGEAWSSNSSRGRRLTMALTSGLSARSDRGTRSSPRHRKRRAAQSHRITPPRPTRRCGRIGDRRSAQLRSLSTAPALPVRSRTSASAPPRPVSSRGQTVAAVGQVDVADRLDFLGPRAGPTFEVGWSRHGGRSSAGRAPACGAGGRGFEPRRSPRSQAPDLWSGAGRAFRGPTDRWSPSHEPV